MSPFATATTAQEYAPRPLRLSRGGQATTPLTPTPSVNGPASTATQATTTSLLEAKAPNSLTEALAMTSSTRVAPARLRASAVAAETSSSTTRGLPDVRPSKATVEPTRSLHSRAALAATRLLAVTVTT